jgi:hypothetical protein
MLTSEDLLLRWNGPFRQVGAYTRVDPVHPLELYIGYEAISQKSMLLISDAEPSLVPSSKSILVSVGQRNDGKWALIFRLIRNEQQEVFSQLCCDLIESSRLQRNEANGVEFVLSRYRRWNKLMEHQGSGLLSESARKGLLGELLFLQRVLAGGMPALDAVSGWIGLGGADRDFVFSAGWHEIKAVGTGAKTVAISSLQQLDASPPGELVIFFVDHTAPGESDSFSLNDKVNEVQSTLQAVPSARDLFDAKLLDFGYMPLREYEVQHYRLGGMCRYNIDDRFPCLTTANVPSQIAAATYELSLGALEDWRTE